MSIDESRPTLYDTNAFAIADTMRYLHCPVHTVAIGQAWGSAAVLLAVGAAGNRRAYPTASITLFQPKAAIRGTAARMAERANELEENRRAMAELIASACGKGVDTVYGDIQNPGYMTAQDALQYGLIDMIDPRPQKVRTVYEPTLEYTTRHSQGAPTE